MRYFTAMKSLSQKPQKTFPVDDERAQMTRYALSPEGKAAIAGAQAEIDAGQGLAADDVYFQSLKDRRAAQRAKR